MLQLVNQNYNSTLTEKAKSKGKYTKSAKVEAANELKKKQFNLSEINQRYYNSFESKFDGKPTSFAQYKVDIGSFMETYEDVAEITITDIENYINGWEGKTRDNKKAHIRSLLQWIVKNNVGGAGNKVSREILIYLI